MKPLQNKKQSRLDKKKRKLEALANISKLNDMDRKRESESNTSVATDEEQNNDVTSKKRLKLNVEEIEAKDGKISDAVMSDEDYVQLKRELTVKRRELKSVPKLRLKLFGENASLSLPPSDRTPIFLTDVQHLIISVLFGSSSPCTPMRWCHIEKGNKLSHTVVCVIDGLSLYDLSSNESQFTSCQDIFEHRLETIMPNKITGQILDEIINAPILNICKDDLIKKHGSLEAAIDLIKNPVVMVNSVFPVMNNEKYENAAIEANDDIETFPRTQLLLSALQMVDEGYPL